MSDLQKRTLLFLFGCIGTRLLIVWLAYKFIRYLPLMGMLALIPAIGFTVIYVGGMRKTGAEVFGSKIWWNDLRPVHAALYALFAYLAIKKQTHAWKVLLLDVMIGLMAFIAHRSGLVSNMMRNNISMT